MLESIVYVISSFATGLGFAYLLRHLAGFPFPWEFDIRYSKEDPYGLVDSFRKLKDGHEVNAVMGNMNAKVCNTEPVLKALEDALEKDVKINIIFGPSYDERSKEFLKLLNNPKVKLFRLDYRPERNFRVIKNEKGKPEWVYVEEHPPGFRCAKSSRLARDYQEIFERLKLEAYSCDVGLVS